MGTCVRDTSDLHREKAVQLRVDKDLTIDEIAERLAISRQTIFHWVRDLPMRRQRRRDTEACRRRDEANSLRYRKHRDAAYAEGQAEYDDLIQEAGFRDFLCMYIGEGSKRNRNAVAICNSDAAVLVLADRWVRRFTRNKIHYGLQYHADQDVDELRQFWGRVLAIDPASIRLQRKSNSNQLAKRTWRSRHGVLTIRVGDTHFRSRLQAWMDRLRAERVDSAGRGA